jgi:ferredoxin-nitrite reductase
VRIPGPDNPVEKIKAAKNGLDLLPELGTLSKVPWAEIPPADLETRLKWLGVFFRKRTPGYFMMRIRMTNGLTNAMQFLTIAEIAERLGNGVVEITTRQQMELRAVQIQDVPEIYEKLKGVDLTCLQTGMDNIRNVNTCPMAGLTPHELLDASPVGKEFTSIFLGNKEFTNLPRKFNVVITGCLENCTHAETQDVCMTPAVAEEKGQSVAGFNLSVGGKMGSGGMVVATPLNVFVTPKEAAQVAAAIVLLFRDEGSRENRTRVRLAFLVDAWGAEKFRAELEKRLGFALKPAGRDVRFHRHNDHMGVQKQKDGNYSVGMVVPVGRVNHKHLREWARLASTYGTGELRLTVAQNVILPHVPQARLEALLDEPLLEEFSPTPHPVSRGLVSCIGTDYCNLALIETKGIAKELAKTLEELVPSTISPITMNWSGCAAACGNHQAADIGFQGIKANVEGKVVDAVHIFVGGKTGPDARPAEKIMELVPVTLLPEVLPMIIKNLKSLKNVRRDVEAEKRVVMVPAEAVYD